MLFKNADTFYLSFKYHNKYHSAASYQGIIVPIFHIVTCLFYDEVSSLIGRLSLNPELMLLLPR